MHPIWPPMRPVKLGPICISKMRAREECARTLCWRCVLENNVVLLLFCCICVGTRSLSLYIVSAGFVYMLYTIIICCADNLLDIICYAVRSAVVCVIVCVCCFFRLLFVLLQDADRRRMRCMRSDKWIRINRAYNVWEVWYTIYIVVVSLQFTGYLVSRFYFLLTLLYNFSIWLNISECHNKYPTLSFYTL